MVSGVRVSDECIYEFNKLKVKHLHKYIFFRIENYEEIIVDVLQQDSDLTSFEDIIMDIRNNLKSTECRYIIADMPIYTPEGVLRNRIYFIFWSPDSAKAKEKMLYASSKESLVQKINGIFKSLEITCDIEEFEEELRAIILNN
ncbi:actin-depolymerizing factor 2, putative [Plasmodium knowlesi strain H]|uniref:Actin-depolymerizing factor 2, putative n=3 Tax=Plasmodium knowlesi TaxID=5850 RepID=A0A5K1VBU8_PLAKH|nr:actin-depolymerizing factor 2, putative [Plasmodium knowlesi strain H]OTN64396.1 putative Actin-depolymerizing factor 2 [Plasmodium knowlesi]CAA9988928.1 actin-depolymerizing factor 2, putative [Plasmodium knowlesi strain H]SBO24773.1 actin-depolymerizing factor 2, putative [Plasmodium knowlesi strain H]SBO28037.1 actin-depolymerizing factor 2, putative [Plasmodium knowlesi strain H]VVS78402.1 actin-depolymerizing factor 2, putative [Plasmodium knowlesi strain H]|eukprot:XP_002261275.1 actin-depolymerizing factor, putative [Plasmodium knowlesi strain H]